MGERIVPIKLAKELRETLGKELVEGDRLLVYLEQTNSGRISKLKFKSARVEKLGTGDRPIVTETLSPRSQKTKKGKILLCHKSSCAKRGVRQIYRTLSETIKQLGLQDKVSIELTGCQKQYKKAPSLILMPGKAKHTYVHPHDLASLLKAHYL